VRVLVNPRSARARAAGRLAPRLLELGAEVLETADPAATTDAARRAAGDGLDRLLVAGGDGTLHHAIQGLAGTPCALGVIPLGTGNDLARALGLPLAPLAALEAALVATPRTIDLGRAGARVFAGVAGVGLDGEVSRRVAAAPRGLRGSAAYAWAVVCAVARFDPPHLEARWDGGAFDGRVMLGAAANSPLFGGGMRIAPAARLDDGLLDVVLVERVSAARLLAVFPRVYRGRHLGHPAVHVARVAAVTFRTAPPTTVYADGEPMLAAGPDEVRLESWPAALRVLA